MSSFRKTFTVLAEQGEPICYNMIFSPPKASPTFLLITDPDSTLIMKRVSFAPDTKFGASRPNRQYSRSNTNYRAGTFSGFTSEDFDNTSFFRDTFFNCSQLKVFTGSPDEVDALLETFEQPTRNEGIVEHHRYRTELLQHLEHFYTQDKVKFKEALKGVDWVLLSMQDGHPVDFALHDTWNVENDPHVDSDTASAIPTSEHSVSSADSCAVVTSGEHDVRTGSPDGLQPPSQLFVQVHDLGVVAQNHAGDGSVATEQSSKPALKSCLKKRRAEEDSIPSAPRRKRRG